MAGSAEEALPPGGTKQGELDTMAKPEASTAAQRVDGASTVKTAATAIRDSSPDLNSDSSRFVDEASALKAAGADLQDVDELNYKLQRRADRVMAKQANETDRKRLEKMEKDKGELEQQEYELRQRLEREQAHGAAVPRNLEHKLASFNLRLEEVKAMIEKINNRIDGRDKDLQESDDDGLNQANEPLSTETRQEFLVRTGKITPFSKAESDLHRDADGDEGLMTVSDGATGAEADAMPEEYLSRRNLTKPGLIESSSTERDKSSSPEATSPKRRRLVRGMRRRSDQELAAQEEFGNDERSSGGPSKVANVQDGSEEYLSSGDADSEPGMTEDSEDSNASGSKRKRPSVVPKGKKKNEVIMDDSHEPYYQHRLEEWIRKRVSMRTRQARSREREDQEESTPEWHRPHPTIPDKTLPGGLRLPGDIYRTLFDYQKTGVQWMWELYGQGVGGIVGDEMGLGKTIQVISFLAGLHYSGILTKPVIIVTPVTILKQWVKEFHTWWPALRVSILHNSASGMPSDPSEASAAARKIVNRTVNEGHVLITPYSGLEKHARLFYPIEWGCAVLDEGHIIKNPNGRLTILAKELKTKHRLILSGTPIQNNLSEFWSMFDFVYPGRLGPLDAFKLSVEIPIRTSNYTNASILEMRTGELCAEVLKNTIKPFLLQRRKADVASDLPSKKEHVLFCRMTAVQRKTYLNYLHSGEMAQIADGELAPLVGIDRLRKICNHPDLLNHNDEVETSKPGYGDPKISGKMQVVLNLLNVWENTDNKVLIFSQSVKMLDILQSAIKTMNGINHARMDGGTPIASRQPLIDKFNNTPDLNVFLLTTRVGGLGTNLTGANRIIIFDPDWNPSTDLQARERAWRLGQQREVEIFRLLIRGAIDEKMYQRQVFKQHLADKILKDVKQPRKFSFQELHDLFYLSDPDSEGKTGQRSKGSKDKSRPVQKLPDLTPASSGTLPGAKADDKSKGKAREEGPAEPAIDQLAGVSKMEDFLLGEQIEEHHGNRGKPVADELIMSQLLAHSGVTSTLDHDDVIDGPNRGRSAPGSEVEQNSRKRAAPDSSVVEQQAKRAQLDAAGTVEAAGRKRPATGSFISEREAKRVARETAAQLEKYAEIASKMPAGTVTWTGTQGTMGRPDLAKPEENSVASQLRRNRAAAIKREVTEAIEAARRKEKGGGSARAPASTSKDGNAKPKDPKYVRMGLLAAELRRFFLHHDGQATKKEVNDQFKVRWSRRDKAQLFESVLTEMCVFKGRPPKGSWTLKKEYK